MNGLLKIDRVYLHYTPIFRLMKGNLVPANDNEILRPGQDIAYTMYMRWNYADERTYLKLGRTVVLVILSAMLFIGQQTRAAGPVYTDKDLERYGTQRGQSSDATGPGGGEVSARTSRMARGSSEIFNANVSSIAAVVAYDEKGRSFSHGSGIVISADGAVLTSYHIISNAASIRVKINDNALPVEGILHLDREHDIAVLKASDRAFRPVTIGDSREVRDGSRIFLMDNPNGSRVNISEGSVNGFREVSGRPMLQISIRLTAGSSGGAIFDQKGELIGVAASTITDSMVNFVAPLHAFWENISLDRVITVREAFYRDPGGSAGYWINLGNSHSAAARYADAIEAYKKATAADPYAVEAYNGLGVAYMNLKRNSDAMIVLRKALSLDPQSAWTRSNLGMAYLEAKMHKEAADELNAAIRVMPELAVAHYNLGIAYTRLEKYTSAVTAYKEAVRLHPAFADAHYGLGLVYNYLDERGPALEEYKILQGLDPALAKKLREKIGQ